MPDSAPAVGQLRAECEGFTRYLIGTSPNEYVIAKYLRGHRTIPYRALKQETRIDRALVGLARWGRIPARIADAYGRCFRPAGALRQKFALLLAILENSPPYHVYLNSAMTSRRGWIAFKIVLEGSAFALCLLTGILLLSPVHLLSRVSAGPVSEGSVGHG